MRGYFHNLACVLLLATGFAWAQGSAQQSTAPPPVSPDTQHQQNPKNPDQPPPVSVNPDEDQPRSQTGTMSGSSAAAQSTSQSQIQDALQRQMSAGAGNVTVSVSNDNTIHLTGTVNTDDQKQQAERIARAAAPDQAIVNDLAVSGSRGSTAGSASTATTPSAAGEANQTGQSSKLPQSDIGSTGPSDVQSRIQTALQQEPSLANSSITVTQKNNSIQLSGTVASKAEKRKAKEIAKANAGGRKVTDNLKVSSSQSSSPRY